MNRAQCISVLLLIIVSHSLAGVHEATHTQADLIECELCATNTDPSDAIPAAEVSLPLLATRFLSLPPLDRAPALSAIFRFYPRGPPLSI